MAYAYKAGCYKCPCVCPATPLTREMFKELDGKNPQLALDLVMLNGILVYCSLREYNLYFKLPEGEMVF